MHSSFWVVWYIALLAFIWWTLISLTFIMMDSMGLCLLHQTFAQNWRLARWLIFLITDAPVPIYHVYCGNCNDVIAATCSITWSSTLVMSNTLRDNVRSLFPFQARIAPTFSHELLSNRTIFPALILEACIILTRIRYAIYDAWIITLSFIFTRTNWL